MPPLPAAIDYGRRLMPSVLSYESQNNPKRLFALSARTNQVDDGFLELTFGEVGRASSYIAQWLEGRFDFGECGKQVTLAYIGIPDVRYNLVFYATLKLRAKVSLASSLPVNLTILKLFLPSPRNPPEVNVSILEEIGCSAVIYSPETQPVAAALKRLQSGLRYEMLPPLADLLVQPAPIYAYDYRFEDMYREPILIIHSSGSTGRPKPVEMTHGTFAIYDGRDFPTVAERINWDITILDFPKPDSLMYEPFPPSHVAGFIFKVVVPLYTQTSIIYGPPLRPPSGPLAIQILKSQKNIRAMILPPTVIEELYHDENAVRLLESLDFICFAGGPLAKVVGEDIIKHTAVCQFYGSTEMGQVRQLFPRRENWAYIELHPDAKQEMQRLEDNEELYELVLHTDETTERTSSLNHNFPHLKEWRTKDIFVPHPSKPNLWKFHARTDDIIVFSTGEKLYPVDFERQVMTLPDVTGALMVGNGRLRAGLLLELHKDHQLGAEEIQRLWPEIERASAQLATQGRISKSMIIVAKPDKPFVRAAKGTIMRRATEKLYAAEIDTMFEGSSKTSGSFVLKPTSFHRGAVMELLRHTLGQVAMDTAIGDDENFYQNGMDSIKTVELVQHLKTSLLTHNGEYQLNWLTLDVIYVNCTLNKLCAVILEFLNDHVLPQKQDADSIIQNTIKKYIGNIRAQASQVSSSIQGTERVENITIALTGSTGQLGTYITERLLSNAKVSLIYCLNRNPNASEQWQEKHGSIDPKLSFLTVDLARPGLGLQEDKKRQLLAHLDLLIHNAWPVNFNHPLTAFESSLDGTLHTMELCSQGSRRPHFFFVSSIASAGPQISPSSKLREISEDLIDDPTAPLAFGYGQSKYVAEHIVHAAAPRFGIAATVLRLGLVCPSAATSNALEDSSDMVAALLRTCVALKAIPADFVPVDWITTDQAVSGIEDLIKQSLGSGQAPGSSRFFNLVNPNRLPWTDAVPEIQKWCGPNANVVSMAKWIEQLQGIVGRVQVDDAPALKKLEVFRLFSTPCQFRRVCLDKLKTISQRVASMEPVRPELLRLWLDNTK